MITDPPRKVVIEATQACPLKCHHCPTGLGILQRPDLMDWELFTKIADEIEGFARHVYITFMGEATLHPRLGDMIRRIKEFASVDLATNAVLVTEEMAQELAPCDVITVTICGLRETYERVHGVDRYEDALRGIKNLLKVHPSVAWTWLSLKTNEHQFEEARALAKSMGARWHPKSVALGIYKRGLAPTDPKYRRYDENSRLIYNRLRCPEFWEVGYICSDGNMALCGFDWAAIDPLGNLWDNTFLEIWNGEKYQEVRRNHLAGKLHPVCRLLCGCPPDQRRDNTYLGEKGFLPWRKQDAM